MPSTGQTLRLTVAALMLRTGEPQADLAVGLGLSQTQISREQSGATHLPRTMVLNRVHSRERRVRKSRSGITAVMVRAEETNPRSVSRSAARRSRRRPTALSAIGIFAAPDGCHQVGFVLLGNVLLGL
ncbi:hypothetical protein ACIOEW_36295 [Streptomyces sp. NPDC087901]|uniref:hypothetical protein n=1 Tax=Streptomyces sp. NPDC087901 TaxID=3365818 RepID=UPI0037F693C6